MLWNVNVGFALNVEIVFTLLEIMRKKIDVKYYVTNTQHMHLKEMRSLLFIVLVPAPDRIRMLCKVSISLMVFYSSVFIT